MGRYSRLWRWCRRLATTALVLLCAALLLYQFVLPRLVAQALRQHLADAGLADSSLQVSAVTPHRLRLNGLAIGDDGRLGVSTIDVAYSPATLRAGRVDSVELVGATWDVRLGRQGLDLGPLARLQTGDGPAAGPLPFDRLDLSAATIQLRFGEHLLRIPVNAMLRPAEDGRLRLAVDVDLAGVPVRLAGWLHPSRASGAHSGRAADFTLQTLARRWRLVAERDARDGALQLRSAPMGPGSDSPSQPGFQGALDIRIGGQPAVIAGALDVALGPRTIEVAGHRAAFRGTSAALDCRLERAQQRARISVRLQVDDLRVGDGPPAQVRLSAEFERAPDRSWQLAVSDLDLEVAGNDMALGTAVRGLSARLQLTGTGSADGLALSPKDVCHVAFRQLDIPGTSALRLDGANIGISAPSGAPMLQVNTGGGGAPMVRSAFRMAARNPLAFRIGELEARFGDLAADVSLSWSPGGPLSLRADVASAAEVRHATTGVVLREARLRLPILLNHATTDAAGSFQIGAIQRGDTQLPGPSGQGRWADGRLAFSGSWPVLPGPALQFSGHLDTAGPAGELTATLAPRPLTDPDAVRRLVTMAGHADIADQLNMDGTLGLDARLEVGPHRLVPRVQLQCRGLSLRHERLEIEVSDATGDIVFDALSPLTTPGGQRLQVGRVRVGPLELHDGVVVFRAEGHGRVLVEQTRWTWGDRGHLLAHGFRIDPADTQTDVDLFLEDLPLADWLRLLTSGRVEGEGRLYGRLPVHYRPQARRKLVWDAGFVYARPGTGWIKVHDSEAARQILTQTIAGLPASQRLVEVRARLLAALQDLEYSLLTFDLVPDEDDVTLRVEVRGRGRQGPDAAELGSLRVNFNGFGDFLNYLLLVKSGWEKKVDDQLDSFFQ